MASAQDPTFVPWHIYERDMQRINETLDKLVVLAQTHALEAAAEQGEKDLKAEQIQNRWKIGLVVIAAVLSLVGNFILNLINSV